MDGRTNDASRQPRDADFAHPNIPAAGRLSSTQAAALQALGAGRRMNQAAAEAGVDRTTLYRWRTRDRDFIEALTDWRVDSYCYSRDRMMAIADEAIDAVEAGVKKGDARLAFRLLLDLGRSVRSAERPPSRARRRDERPSHHDAGPSDEARMCDEALWRDEVPCREQAPEREESEWSKRFNRAAQKCTDEQLSRLPELLGEMIEIDAARQRARRAQETADGHLMPDRVTSDDATSSDGATIPDRASGSEGASPIDEAPAQEGPADACTELPQMVAWAVSDAIEVAEQEGSSVETEATSVDVSCVAQTPAAASSDDGAPADCLPVDSASDEAHVAAEAGDTDVTEAGDFAGIYIKPAPAIEHKAVYVDHLTDDATENAVLCCKRLHDDALGGWP